MKKMKTVLGALLGLFLVASFAYAEIPEKPLHIYLQGGATLPTGDLKDMYKTGFNVGGGIGFSLHENFEIVGRVLYHSLALDVEGDYDGGEFTPLMYGGELKFNTGDEERNFYLLGGLGLAKATVKEIKSGGYVVMEEQKEDGKYFCFGAGVEFGKFFIEGRYVILKADDDDDDDDDDSPYEESSSSSEDDVKIIPICIGFKF